MEQHIEEQLSLVQMEIGVHLILLLVVLIPQGLVKQFHLIRLVQII